MKSNHCPNGSTSSLREFRATLVKRSWFHNMYVSDPTAPGSSCETRWYTQLLFSFFFLNGVQRFSIRLMIRMCRQHPILQKYPLRQSLHVFALAAFAVLVALRGLLMCASQASLRHHWGTGINLVLTQQVLTQEMEPDIFLSWKVAIFGCFNKWLQPMMLFNNFLKVVVEALLCTMTVSPPARWGWLDFIRAHARLLLRLLLLLLG